MMGDHVGGGGGHSATLVVGSRSLGLPGVRCADFWQLGVLDVLDRAFNKTTATYLLVYGSRYPRKIRTD